MMHDEVLSAMMNYYSGVRNVMNFYDSDNRGILSRNIKKFFLFGVFVCVCNLCLVAEISCGYLLV